MLRGARFSKTVFKRNFLKNLFTSSKVKKRGWIELSHCNWSKKVRWRVWYRNWKVGNHRNIKETKKSQFLGCFLLNDRSQPKFSKGQKGAFRSVCEKKQVRTLGEGKMWPQKWKLFSKWPKKHRLLLFFYIGNYEKSIKPQPQTTMKKTKKIVITFQQE